MGLFRRKTGKLVVKFYGNPNDTLVEDEVSVVYTIYPITYVDNVKIATDFYNYVNKVLYNLGEGLPAYTLASILQEKIVAGLRKGEDILHGDNYSLKKVNEKSGHVKIYEATFFESGWPKLRCSWRGEDYNAPMSVLAFLQHLTNNLSEKDLREVSDTLKDFFAC